MAVQGQQGVAFQPGGIQSPASGAVVGPGHGHSHVLLQSAQLKHQPGAMRPGAAAAKDQMGAIARVAIDKL